MPKQVSKDALKHRDDHQNKNGRCSVNGKGRQNNVGGCRSGHQAMAEYGGPVTSTEFRGTQGAAGLPFGETDTDILACRLENSISV